MVTFRPGQLPVYNSPVFPEIGTVKAYLPDRGFGFLNVTGPDSRPVDGPDVYFHYDAGRYVEGPTEPTRWNQPVFAGSQLVVRGAVGFHPPQPIPEPTHGETLVFVRGANKQGKPRAAIWARWHDWTFAQLVQDEARYSFRLLVTYVGMLGSGDMPCPADRVLWNGTDLVSASLLWPANPDALSASPGRRGNGRDALDTRYVGRDKFRARFVWQDHRDHEWATVRDPRIPDCCLPEHLLPRGWRRTDYCEHQARESDF